MLQSEYSTLYSDIEVFRKIQLVVIAGQGSGFVETMLSTISDIVNGKTKQTCNYPAKINIGQFGVTGRFFSEFPRTFGTLTVGTRE